MPDSVAAEPRVLADWELDSITAAGVLLDVNSIAAALGDFASTRTDANIFTLHSDDLNLDTGVGVTTGQAFACCGEDADVEVGSTAVGMGDYVRGITHTIGQDGSERHRFARGFSLGFVLAISSNSHFANAREEHGAMLEQLRAALSGFRVELPTP